MMDVDDSGSLDLNEVTPCIKYLCARHMGVPMSSAECRQLSLMFDDDATSDINFGELLVIIRYMVKAQQRHKLDAGESKYSVAAPEDTKKMFRKMMSRRLSDVMMPGNSDAFSVITRLRKIQSSVKDMDDDLDEGDLYDIQREDIDSFDVEPIEAQQGLRRARSRPSITPFCSNSIEETANDAESELVAQLRLSSSVLANELQESIEENQSLKSEVQRLQSLLDKITTERDLDQSPFLLHNGLLPRNKVAPLPPVTQIGAGIPAEASAPTNDTSRRIDGAKTPKFESTAQKERRLERNRRREERERRRREQDDDERSFSEL